MDQESSPSNANLTTNLIIDNKKKWKCSQCTYENWPSAIKCTICLTNKTLQHKLIKKSKLKVIKLKPNTITSMSSGSNTNNNESSSLENTNLINISSSSNENLNDLNSNELVLGHEEQEEGHANASPPKMTNDIYEIGHQLLASNNNSDLGYTTTSTTSDTISNQNIEKQKWPCSVCTYLNWPKSTKCVQCYTPKVVTTPNAITTTVDEQSSSLAMLNDGDNKNKHLTSLNEQLQQNLIINNNNRSSCNSPCTVPKQQQLIGEKYSEILEPFNEQNTTPTVMIESTAKKWSCSGCTYQNWPKSQRCVMCNLQRNNPTTTTSNNSSTSSSKGSSSKTSLNYQQKLKTYQLQMDRLFLAACQGIVDDDMTHLNRYINANGDLTRYLTSDEVKLLNRPNVFTVGLTLLHLCYQFKRKEFLMQILSTNSTNKNTKKINNTSTTTTTTMSSSTMNLLNALLKQANKTKFSPCQSCPALANNIIERYFSANLRQRKTPNHYFSHRHHDHFYHHVSPTSSLTSLTTPGSSAQSAQTQSQTPTLQQQQQQATGLNTNQTSISNSNSFNLSPSPSPPPSATLGATSIYYQQPQSLCFYVNECYTFILPNEIEDFSPRIQHILFDELLDREVQQELENESRVINWNIDLCKRLDSRLYPLWNRHSGDCLLDSVLQASYGVFDTDNTLRRIMAESLEQYANCFKPRWKEHEILMAQSLDYTLDDYQLEQDWNNIITLANQPGASLEQAHIFALCHIFRRPIIIYSIKYVKSFRGENIGFTHFEGVYLPLIWEPNFCFKSPIALGYTRGHFTALVPLERSEAYDLSSSTTNQAGAVSSSSTSQYDFTESSNQQQIFYLPLTNSEGQLLPIHFLTSSELGRERAILRQYLNLDCLVMPGNNCGLYVAQQRVTKRGVLVRQMLDEWLSYYRNMQMKQNGTQIEISQENETINLNKKNSNTSSNTPTTNSSTNLTSSMSSTAKNNLNQEEYLVNNNNDDDEEDDDFDDDDDDDLDDDDDDDEEPEDDDDDDEDDEEEEEEEYCEQINIEEN